MLNQAITERLEQATNYEFYTYEVHKTPGLTQDQSRMLKKASRAIQLAFPNIFFVLDFEVIFGQSRLVAHAQLGTAALKAIVSPLGPSWLGSFQYEIVSFEGLDVSPTILLRRPLLFSFEDRLIKALVQLRVDRKFPH